MLKFKYLLIAFSVLAVVILVLSMFIPVLLSGVSGSLFSINLWYITLPLLIFMVLLLVFMSVFFFTNYKLLSLLEKEDWPALAFYLENKIYTKGRYTSRNVRLLASSYLVISDYQSVLKLENKTQTVNPGAVSKNTLVFGAARILSGNHSDAVSFYKSNLDKCRKREQEWVRWFAGFSQILSGAFAEAESEFMSMAVSSRNVIITGLCAYFLNSTIEKKSANSEKCRQVSESGKKRVKDALKNAGDWKKETGKAGNEIHIAVIRKYIDEAGKFIFA